MDLSTY